MLNLKLAGPFSDITLDKQLWLLLILSSLVLTQSIGVIYVKQQKRLVHAQLQSTYKKQDAARVEWGQLLLEEGTWQADARVEKIARDKLKMVVPNKVNVIVP